MYIDLTFRELVYLDYLCSADSSNIQHKLDRDYRLFDRQELEMHERTVKRKSRIKLANDIKAKIVNAVSQSEEMGFRITSN